MVSHFDLDFHSYADSYTRGLKTGLYSFQVKFVICRVRNLGSSSSAELTICEVRYLNSSQSVKFAICAVRYVCDLRVVANSDYQCEERLLVADSEK